MVEFRQKIFFNPLAIASVAGSLLGGGEPTTKFGKTMAGANFVSTAANNKRQANLQEEQMRQEARTAKMQAAEQTKQAKIQAKAQEKIAKQQAKATAQAAKNGANVNVSSSLQPQQQQFSKTSEAKGFVKNLGTLAKERGLHKAMAGAIVGGAVAGGASYLVDKGIQRDIKKDRKFKVALSEHEKKELKRQRNKKLLTTLGTGAALVGTGVAAKKGLLGESAKKYITKENAKKVGNTFKEATKDYFTHVNPETGKRKANVLHLALTGVSVAAPAVMYRMKKKKYEDQVKQSEEGEERNYSKTSGINFQNLSKKARITIKRLKKRKEPSARAVGDTFQTASREINFRQQLKKVAPKVTEKWSEFKKHPGESTLGKISSFVGGGGRSGVSKFGEDLTSLGVKTGNTTSQKVGDFITNNPKTALAGSILLGGVVIKKAKDKAGNLATKAIETVDPNAYAYSKYGARPIPVRKKNSQEEEENNG